MYVLLFVCIYTSTDWITHPSLSLGEIFRFDKVRVFGQASIYHLFAATFFLIILFKKFSLNNDKNFGGERNYLKNIFWAYFIPVNILVYFTIYIKKIELDDLGVQSLAQFFFFLMTVLYVQDIFFKNKNNRELTISLTIIEVLIMIRCCYTIIKHMLGYGYYVTEIGQIRIGQENDFADFFLLLFIIALVRLLFNKKENIKLRTLHVLSIVMTSYVIIFSFRRYLWAEYVVALFLILLIHYYVNTVHSHKLIYSSCFLFVLVFSLLLFLGPNRLVKNMFIGRLLTTLSLVDAKFESQYGTQNAHVIEIEEGWYNVKKNWLLGVSPYGKKLVKRIKTVSETRDRGVYVHSGYLLIWLLYGLLGLILFLILILKSLRLSYQMFFRLNNSLGLILLIFLIPQILKNIIWHTAITLSNMTVIYIFLISLVLRAKRLEQTTKNEVMIESTP